MPVLCSLHRGARRLALVHLAVLEDGGYSRRSLVWEAAGLKVHAYTSPHLARFHERIYLAGQNIAEPHLSAILDECYAANDGDPITYFEITTCAALLAFARTQADYTLLEVGLGGRLDATTAIPVDASILAAGLPTYEPATGPTGNSSKPRVNA